jgi:GcrA cell cycle regulator
MKPLNFRSGSFWNKERDVELRRLWLADEHSAEEIASLMGASSRNAVIGRVHRIGLPGKAGKARGKTKGASLGVHPRETAARVRNARKGRPFVLHDKVLNQPKISAEPTPIPPPLEFDVPRIATADLEPNHCRWPCPDDVRDLAPGAPIFCGLEKMPGSRSYCRDHHLRAYPPLPPRPRPPMMMLPQEHVESEMEAA